MRRKIYDDLLFWKNNSDQKPLMLLGVRQIGKKYILNEFCQNEFKHYVYVNLLERDDIVRLYDSSVPSDEKFNQFKSLINLNVTEDTILFIDEIQESDNLISELKYFCEKHPEVKIVCAGSLLGVKVKRTSKSFPVGKVHIIHMYPMDFEEFLMAFNEDLLISQIKESYGNDKPFSNPLHEKAIRMYQLYLITGDMPESVKNMIEVDKDFVKYDTNIISSIIESYFNDMKKYITNTSETLKIERIYRSLPSQLANNSNKFQFSKVEKGAKAVNYETALDWLLASNMVCKVNCVSTGMLPLAGFIVNDVYKLFLSDVGILNRLLDIKINDILTDSISLYKGIIAENFVANQLIANKNNIYYWRNNYAAEVDFLITINSKVIPTVVKAGSNTGSKSLKSYMQKYNPEYGIRVSLKNFGFNDETKIKSVPLYATFCIKDNSF